MNYYRYLKTTDANLFIKTYTDVNKVEVYKLNLANSSSEFYTEPVGFYHGKDVNYRLEAVDSISGTGNATLQTSFDKVNWFDTEDVNSNNVVINLTSSFSSENVQEINAFGNYHRWKFSGSNTDGNVKIYSTVK